MFTFELQNKLMKLYFYSNWYILRNVFCHQITQDLANKNNHAFCYLLDLTLWQISDFNERWNHWVTILQFRKFSRRRCCCFLRTEADIIVSSQMSKKLSHDLTLLPLWTIVKIVPTTSRVTTGACEVMATVKQSVKI